MLRVKQELIAITKKMESLRKELEEDMEKPNGKYPWQRSYGKVEVLKEMESFVSDRMTIINGFTEMEKEFPSN